MSQRKLVRHLGVWTMLLACSLTARAADLLDSANFLPPTVYETSAKVKRVDILADRKVYLKEDGLGQFLVSFLGQETAGKSAAIEVVNAATGQPVWSKSLAMTQPKVALLLNVGSLPAGKYALKASIPPGADGKPVEAKVEFAREDKSAANVPFPADGLEIFVDPPPPGDLSDASWPICAGVPFPQGTLAEARRLTLFENGVAVPAQVDPVAWWGPKGEHFTPAVKWAHVNFEARYDKGIPRKYVLKQSDAPLQAAGRISVTTVGDKLVVENGLMRFTVNTKRFAGVDEAWIDLNGDGAFTDAERALGSSAPKPDPKTAPIFGAYLMDQRGIEYRAASDKQAGVVVEESGPFRVVIAADGWYCNADVDPTTAIPKLCKFRTRIIAWAGRTDIRLQHQTIITYDTNNDRLLDLGFRLPLPGGRQFAFGYDGRTARGDLPALPATAFLHQYRWNKLRVIGAKTADPKKPVLEGEKSDGWVTVSSGAASDKNAPAVTLMMRDLWQKFPKELEASRSDLIAHFWPAHGLLTFNDQERLGRTEIFKLRSMHEGMLMDLRLPSDMFAALDAFNAEERWDWEAMRFSAIAGNGQGVAVGNDLLIRLHPAHAADQLQQARLFQLSPLARASGQWNTATQVLERLSPSNPKLYPELERTLNRVYPDYLKVITEGAAEYGMWIYADIHDLWKADVRAPRLHRVWFAGHYQQIWTPWAMYFRGGPPEILEWARANSDHFRDINVIHYDDPNHPLKFHITGAMYHCKGFLPWGSSAYGDRIANQINPDNNAYGGEHAGLAGHWINPDALLLRYMMEGDFASLDALNLWHEGLKRNRIPAGNSRNHNTTLGEMVSLYGVTWDPDLLWPMQGITESMFSRPLEQMADPYAHPVFHQNWFSRLYDMTRDPRLVAAFKVYNDEGHQYGRQYPNVGAFLYFATGDKNYVIPFVGGYYDRAREVYDNPADPLNGYCDGIASGTGNWFYRAAIYWIAAAEASGVKELAAGAHRNTYPSQASHPQFIANEPGAMEMLVYNPEARPFHFTLESVPGHDHYDPLIRLHDPAGKLILDRPGIPGGTRFVYERFLHLDLPPAGQPAQRGLYRFDFRNNEGMTFLAPYTDLAIEGILLPRAPSKPYTRGRLDAYFIPVGDTPKAKLVWNVLKAYDMTLATYLRVEDANGKVMFETTMLYGSTRTNAQLEINANDPAHPAPFHVYALAEYGPGVSWDGPATAMVVALKPQVALELARHLPELVRPAQK